MEEVEEQKVSKFSSGVNILIRLDSLWKDVNNHSRLGLYSRWNADLDRIWCELARDLKETDYNNRKIEFDKFEKDIGQTGKFEDNATDGFKPLIPEQIKKRNEQYKLLMEKELFLRRLENYLGKGTTWSDEDEDDFD